MLHRNTVVIDLSLLLGFPVSDVTFVLYVFLFTYADQLLLEYICSSVSASVLALRISTAASTTRTQTHSYKSRIWHCTVIAVTKIY